MADKRISDLNSAGLTVATDEIIVLRSGVNYKAQLGNLSAFNTNVAISAGTPASSEAALSITQTWNDANVAFTGISVAITDTASGNISNLISLSASSGASLNVDNYGLTTSRNRQGYAVKYGSLDNAVRVFSIYNGDSNAEKFRFNTHDGNERFWMVSSYLGFGSPSSPDVSLRREDANGLGVWGEFASAYRDLTVRDLTANANITAGNLTVTGTSNVTVSGLQTIWLPAPAMTARTSNGAVSNSTESTTNKIMLPTFDFVQTGNTYVQFTVAMPKGWDLGNITAEFYWFADTGTGNVTWCLQGVAVSDNESLDAAFGTEASVTQALAQTGNLQHTSTTGNVTIAGSPTAGDLVFFQAYRDASTDTLTANARLAGVKVFYTASTLDDA